MNTLRIVLLIALLLQACFVVVESARTFRFRCSRELSDRRCDRMCDRESGSPRGECEYRRHERACTCGRFREFNGPREFNG
ncbi:hypothetical protein BV898_16042 [Hypsibius exemplaris]|uniref:Invertebrate defensins family profile domain-containing protein n=1 Tax=Hypsibius exemplaris TaxID=2072580 RepID=A0A9X6NCS9_HYPEX|nr:hypothetical protein BV898_16042 [Hypsibius exemplaris]